MYSRSNPRRRHDAELKAKVLAACDVPGASTAGVALAHGLNANLVRKWRAGHGLKRAGSVVEPAAAIEPPRRPVSAAPPVRAAKAEFVAVEMPASLEKTVASTAVQANAAPSADPIIQVELRRGPLQLSVRWPSSAADDCTAWLRELSADLLK